MPLKQILKLSIDLADALTRAHKLNIIHRDLKPANVLIGNDGVLQLTDFGVAHVGSKNRVTETDALVGTIDYLPPEAFDGKSFDALGDIWAFGVMLFEMLVGERPFRGITLIEIIQAIMTQPIPDLEALCPDVPIALVDMVYRMLERDPQARIPSVRIVGAELEAVLEGRDQTPQTPRFAPAISDFSSNSKPSLPAQTTPFVGREHELAELDKLLADASLRLITVIAPGGMGKTRLVLEAGQRALNQFRHGVHFVELAPLNDLASMVSAIADAIGYSFQNDERTPKQQILDFLASNNMLLILDNYEHLLENAQLVSEILHAASDVQILVTSRQRLSQVGEILFHLSGMDFPDWETTEDALNYAAIKLFLNSARRARPDFTLANDNLNDIARICRLVQGMPLGIVLAAGWLGLLSLAEITDEIQQGLDFLETTETDLPERQRSIRAVMDYSWRHMTPSEKHIFMQVSVFRGGFTREAVQAVSGATLRDLMALVNKSAIRRNNDIGRYAIHELLRQYAAEQLEHSDIAQKTHETHMAYYTEYMNRHEKNIRGEGQQIAALRIIEQDIENVQVAWNYATEHKYLDIIDDLMSGLFHFYDMRGWKIKGEQEFRKTADVLRSLPPHQTQTIMGKLLARQANFVFSSGAHELASQMLNESLSLLDNTANLDELDFTLNALADITSFLGNFTKSKGLCERSLAIFRQTNDQWGIAATLNNLGVTFYFLDDYDKAIEYYEESLEISRRIGDWSGVAALLSNLGAIAHDQQDYDHAMALYDESMIISQKLHDQYGVASVKLNLGWTMYIVGQLEQAYRQSLQGYQLATRLGNRLLATTGQINLGTIACELDDLINDSSEKRSL